MNRQDAVKKPEPQKAEIKWYCANCWQEGITPVEFYPPDFPSSDPSKIKEVIRDHKAIIRGIPGGKCSGIIRPQEKHVKPRVRRENPPLLPESGEPLIIR